MRGVFSDEEVVAWPSYVDFLFAFSFILVLSLGYMAFESVHGVEEQDFEQEAVSGATAFQGLSVHPVIDYDNHRVEISLNGIVNFDEGCPKKPTCEQYLTDQEKRKLGPILQGVAKQYPNARLILLRGEASLIRGSDEFQNFRLGNLRALMVYQFLFACKASCGFDETGGPLNKVQLANAGDKRANASHDAREDQTVTIVIDYNSGQ